MANFGDRLKTVFGFGDVKTQQRPAERPYASVRESSIFQPVFEGVGGIQDALARRGTGFTDKLTAPATSNIYARGATALKDRLAGVGATASAGGLGRSSLRTAQGVEAARRQTLEDQAQALDLERQSQLQEISQQMQGRGLGVNVLGKDIAAKGERARFEQDVFGQQETARRADEATELAGAQKSAQLGMMAGGGLMGGPAGLALGTMGGNVIGGGSKVNIAGQDMDSGDYQSILKILTSILGSS